MTYYAVQETFVPTLKLRIFYDKEDRDKWVAALPDCRRTLTSEEVKHMFPLYWARKKEILKGIVE